MHCCSLFTFQNCVVFVKGRKTSQGGTITASCRAKSLIPNKCNTLSSCAGHHGSNILRVEPSVLSCFPIQSNEICFLISHIQEGKLELWKQRKQGKQILLVSRVVGWGSTKFVNTRYAAKCSPKWKVNLGCNLGCILLRILHCNLGCILLCISGCILLCNLLCNLGCNLGCKVCQHVPVHAKATKVCIPIASLKNSVQISQNSHSDPLNFFHKLITNIHTAFVFSNIFSFSFSSFLKLFLPCAHTQSKQYPSKSVKISCHLLPNTISLSSAHLLVSNGKMCEHEFESVLFVQF